MEIKNFIKIYDDVLPIEVISNIIKYANSLKFNEATIVGKQQTGKELNLNIRKTYTYPLTNLSNMMSDVHWANLLRSTFKAFINKYVSDLGIHNIQLKELDYPQVLKYTAGGFYDWHIDDAVIFPRTLSIILLLNNDYEGGNLGFKNVDGSEEFFLDVKPARLIIWPSNFMFPHTVKPVTKGLRYSIVSWVR